MRSYTQRPAKQHQRSCSKTPEKNGRNAPDWKSSLQVGAQSVLQKACGSCRVLAKYAYNSALIFVFREPLGVKFKRSSITKQTKNMNNRGKLYGKLRILWPMSAGRFGDRVTGQSSEICCFPVVIRIFLTKPLQATCPHSGRFLQTTKSKKCKKRW